ncbi:hypothetical protein L5515_013403 [Caenorhabditis briggsae]|uniref:Uncharacterized protein n=1 Tax=Caenorhabditis briggsae TaxID=6238 RepID=A0AAE9EB89_CAEBR|nr:hypothetical protein L5515_013403 [Caenorhabditis briggsae]
MESAIETDSTYYVLMASYILNALTLRHDHDAAERTLHHFWDTKDLLDTGLFEEHITSQPLLAASLFSLIACSIGLIVFAIIFLICRFRGQCGSQKYQEYPSNATNYAIYLMLFFISWLIVTSASAYFVLAGIGFWSEKLDARKPFTNASLVRLSRSTIGDLYASYDYHGDFENVSEAPRKSLKRIHIHRKPLLQTFRKRIEIPIRPLAEVTFTGTSDKFITKNRRILDLNSNQNDGSEEDKIDEFESFKRLQNLPEPSLPTEEEIKNQVQEHSGIPGIAEIFGNSEDPEDVADDSEEAETSENQSLVVTGGTMTIEEEDSEDVESEESTTTTTTITMTTTTTVPITTVPTTTASTTKSTTTVAPTMETTKTTTTTTKTTTTASPSTISAIFPEVTWTKIEETNSDDVLDQLLTHAETHPDVPADNSLSYNPNLTYFSLHSRFLVFVCRLTFCFVALALLFVILPTFFLVVAGTGCYIYSDHPMNRSSVSNKIGQVVSINASILLFMSPCMLIFSSFTLFYTHCHELLCATIQLQNQQARGIINTNHQSLIENYSINTNQCARSLAPVQSLLLSSLLLCISLLPCVFAMFKLVKYYFRMSSEFYWNAADNFAGRQFSKQQDFPRYQSTVIYPDDDMTAGYAVYGQI